MTIKPMEKLKKQIWIAVDLYDINLHQSFLNWNWLEQRKNCNKYFFVIFYLTVHQSVPVFELENCNIVRLKLILIY